MARHGRLTVRRVLREDRDEPGRTMVLLSCECGASLVLATIAELASGLDACIVCRRMRGRPQADHLRLMGLRAAGRRDAATLDLSDGGDGRGG